MATQAKQVPVKSAGEQRSAHPLMGLRGDIDRVFENFLSGWPGARWPSPFRDFGSSQFALSPDIDVSETEAGYEIEAELPGLDDKDIELTLVDNVLTLKGEKQAQREEKKKDYYLSERSYGAFQRSFTLPSDVDASKIDTKFSKGVLTVILPKSAEAKAKTRKIEVKAA